MFSQNPFSFLFIRNLGKNWLLFLALFLALCSGAAVSVGACHAAACVVSFCACSFSETGCLYVLAVIC